MDTPKIVGTEWLVEASGCSRELLRDASVLRSVFTAVIRDLGLKTVGQPIWHSFPGEGGITGMVALSESHLTCHTYPEFRTVTFNLYCCNRRPEWDWQSGLMEKLGATTVSVSKIVRGAPGADEESEQFKIDNDESHGATSAGGKA